MLTKLRMLYELLKPETRAYIDTIKVCPRVDRKVCALAPASVRKLYFAYAKQEHGRQSNEDVGKT